MQVEQGPNNAMAVVNLDGTAFSFDTKSADGDKASSVWGIGMLGSICSRHRCLKADSLSARSAHFQYHCQTNSTYLVFLITATLILN